MKKPSNNEDLDSLRDKLIGLGEQSVRKSYYPELQQRLEELERFRALLDQSNDAIFLVHVKTGCLIDINQSACRLLNYSREELLALSLVKIIGDTEIKRLLKLYSNRVLVQANPEMHESLVYTRNGEIIPVEVNIRVVKFNDSTYAVAVARDIRERKQAERALAYSKAMYKGIFTSSNSPVFLLDTDQFAIQEANPAAAQISGYSVDELKQLKFMQYSPNEEEETLQKLKKHLAIAFTEGTSIFNDLAIRKNGEVIPILVNLTHFSLEEQKCVLAVVQDLSEQIKHQQEKDKLARLEAQVMKMTTLSVMSAGIVHEISQPLNAVKILADGMIFLWENGHKVSEEETFSTFAKISVQAERIHDIIKHIRNLAYAGEDYDYSPSDLNNAVSGGIKLVGEMISAHNIKLELQLASLIEPVLGQQQRLEEIVINLVVNAVNALRNYEREEKKIVCSTRQEGTTVLLEVADNGPGISPEVGQKIWEPFFSTQNQGTGMGLGLALVQSITARLRGTISYHNNEWGGATFVVELPIWQEVKAL